MTKAQHRLLRRILVEQLDDVLAQVEKADPDLQALFERPHRQLFAGRAGRNEGGEAGMAANVDELGLDVEVPPAAREH